MDEDTPRDNDTADGSGSRAVLLAVAWLWVTLPFLYGVYQLILTARKLFTG